MASHFWLIHKILCDPFQTYCLPSFQAVLTVLTCINVGTYGKIVSLLVLEKVAYACKHLKLAVAWTQKSGEKDKCFEDCNKGLCLSFAAATKDHNHTCKTVLSQLNEKKFTGGINIWEKRFYFPLIKTSNTRSITTRE